LQNIMRNQRSIAKYHEKPERSCKIQWETKKKVPNIMTNQRKKVPKYHEKAEKKSQISWETRKELPNTMRAQRDVLNVRNQERGDIFYWDTWEEASNSIRNGVESYKYRKGVKCNEKPQKRCQIPLIWQEWATTFPLYFWTELKFIGARKFSRKSHDNFANEKFSPTKFPHDLSIFGK
jgi:hypothetical protein